MSTFIDYLLGGAANGAVIALIALALVLTWRSSRVVNFAQVGQAMISTGNYCSRQAQPRQSRSLTSKSKSEIRIPKSETDSKS